MVGNWFTQLWLQILGRCDFFPDFTLHISVYWTCTKCRWKGNSQNAETDQGSKQKDRSVWLDRTVMPDSCVLPSNRVQNSAKCQSQDSSAHIFGINSLGMFDICCRYLLTATINMSKPFADNGHFCFLENRHVYMQFESKILALCACCPSPSSSCPQPFSPPAALQQPQHTSLQPMPTHCWLNWIQDLEYDVMLLYSANDKCWASMFLWLLFKLDWFLWSCV